MSKRLDRIRVQLILVSSIWLVVLGWFAIVQMPHDALLTKESQEVQDRMEVECTGSYQQRYDCKNSIAIEVTNHSLFQVTIRIIIWLTGPVIAFGYYKMQKKLEPPPPPPPIVHDDMSWKTSARSHIAQNRMDDDDDYAP
jgi:hypothetical protein